MKKAVAAQWPADKVERRPVASLVPAARNARTHSPEQVDQIVASIKEWGWTVPVLIDEQGCLIAGHGRVLAAKKLGLEQIPVIVAADWTEAQKRAYALADNKLALNSGWDESLLKIELGELKALNFDLAPIGFSPDELGGIFADKTAGLTDPDDAPEPPARPVSRLGDVWLMGKHRLVCGDSTSAEAVAVMLRGMIPDLANCDPPYGVSIVKRTSVGGAKPFGATRGVVHSPGPDGFTRGRVHGPARRAIIKPGVYAPIIGDDSTDTAIASYAVLAALSVPAIALWGGQYFADRLPASRCWLVWDKENTGTFADVEMAWTNCDQTSRLFRHQWSGLIKASERGERRVHPTQKPVALAEWVFETVAPKAKTVVDLFLGSGSTLIAAERVGLTCFGMELAPAYIDIAILRWQTFTGREATLEATGMTFAATAAERHKQQAP